MNVNLFFRPNHLWWRGQNQRTFEIEDFPRRIADPMRPLNQEDISDPLPNSCIHTGILILIVRELLFSEDF